MPRAGSIRHIWGWVWLPAVKKALKLAKLSLKDIDYIELNEAFASQSIGVIKDLGIDMGKTKPLWRGISLDILSAAPERELSLPAFMKWRGKNLQFGLGDSLHRRRPGYGNHSWRGSRLRMLSVDRTVLLLIDIQDRLTRVIADKESLIASLQRADKIGEGAWFTGSFN